MLESDEFFGSEPFLLLNAGAEPVVRPSDEIAVQGTGIVRQFIIADIEREYGLDLDDELYIDYEDRPVVIADSVALAPSVEELAENPTAFYDQVIAVEGEVGELFSSNTMSLYEFSGGTSFLNQTQVPKSPPQAIPTQEVILVLLDSSQSLAIAFLNHQREFDGYKIDW